jgi:hypothetical protein
MTAFEPWSYRETTKLPGHVDVVGFEVEATDGGIGSIDSATYEAGSSWVVVDTGPWIFGRKVLIPAGTIREVDAVGRKVHIDRTKDEIKSSPEFDPNHDDVDYRERLGTYYGEMYRARM